MLAHGSPAHQLWTWHHRLGHPSLGYLKRLFPSLNNCTTSLDCETCVLAKSHKHSYYPSNTHAPNPFDVIHSDVWGPAPHMNSHGFKYFVLFVDDCSRMCWVYFLKHKSEVFDVFVKYYNMILTQFNAKPRILRSDNGGEYISVAMKQFFRDHGLVHQTSYPDTPQQNGVAERKNRTLLEVARALMFETHIPVRFWPEAIATATYLTNRLPTKSSISKLLLPPSVSSLLFPLLIPFLLAYLGVLCMSIFPLGYKPSLNHGQSNVCFLGMALLKRAIDVMILSITNSIPPWIVTSLNTLPTIPNLDLRGRV